MNYVHHNPVRHRYVERWTEWPWSSARQYVAQTDPEEAKPYLQDALSLEDVAGDLRAPTLLLNGRHDPIFPPRQMELVIDALAAAPVEVVIEEAGDHCCHNMAHLIRPRMADWLAAALRGG